MLQLKSGHGYVLTFTPQSNEFTITLLSSSTPGHTAGLCGNKNAFHSLASIADAAHRSLRCVKLSVLVLQARVGRWRLTSSLYVMAALLQTSQASSQTGLWLQMEELVCQSVGPFVCLEHQWDVRPYVQRSLNRAMRTFLFRCSLLSVRSRHVTSQTCVSSFPPTPASADREACVWTGGAPTSAVSPFLMCA